MIKHALHPSGECRRRPRGFPDIGEEGTNAQCLCVCLSVYYRKDRRDPLFQSRHFLCVRRATGWFRLNAQNCVPGNSSRRFFELDHEILHTYSGRQYLKLEEGGFLIWGFAVEISGF